MVTWYTLIPFLRKRFGPLAVEAGLKEVHSELGDHFESILFLGADRFVSFGCGDLDQTLRVRYGPSHLVDFENDEYYVAYEKAQDFSIDLQSAENEEALFEQILYRINSRSEL